MRGAHGWIPHLSDRLDLDADVDLSRYERSDDGSWIHESDMHIGGDGGGVPVRIVMKKQESGLSFVMELEDRDRSLNSRAEIDDSGMVMVHCDSSDGDGYPFMDSMFFDILRCSLKAVLPTGGTHSFHAERDWVGPIECTGRGEAVERLKDEYVLIMRSKLQEIRDNVPNLIMFSSVESMLNIHPLLGSRLEGLGGGTMSVSQVERINRLLSSAGLSNHYAIGDRGNVISLRRDVEELIDEGHQLMAGIHLFVSEQMGYGSNFCRLFDNGGRSAEVLMNYMAAIETEYGAYSSYENRMIGKASERSGSYALENAQMTKVLTYAVIVLTVTSVMAALV